MAPSAFPLLRTSRCLSARFCTAPRRTAPAPIRSHGCNGSCGTTRSSRRGEAPARSLADNLQIQRSHRTNEQISQRVTMYTGMFWYLTCWRRGEIVSLRWDAVDRSAREVRLRTSKNGEGRMLPLEGDLWDLIERRWAGRTIELNDGTTRLSEFVFHGFGERVVDFRKPWKRGVQSGERAAEALP